MEERWGQDGKGYWLESQEVWRRYREEQAFLNGIEFEEMLTKDLGKKKALELPTQSSEKPGAGEAVQ